MEQEKIINREIKFRAWSKQSERMINSVGVDPFHVNDLDRFYWNHDQVELMQYIGVKDKNGKEIYGADILLFELNGEVQHMQVMHSTEWEGRISTHNAPFMSAWGMTCGKYFYTFMNIYDPTRYGQIVGNIYETPHLL